MHDLNSLGYGVRDGDRLISVPLFADDIAVLAKSEEDLQQMLTVIHKWCEKWQLCINPDKSKVVHFRFNGKQISSYVFKIGSAKIEYTIQYKYLGFWMNEHLDYSYSVDQIAKSASRALAAVTSKFYKCGGMSHGVYTKLYQSLVEPVYLYSSPIWGLKSYKVINNIQRQASKVYLGLSKTSTNDAAIGDMGWKSCYTRQLAEVYRLYIRLANMDPSRITYNVFKNTKQFSKSHYRLAIKEFRKYDIDTDFAKFQTKYTVRCQIGHAIEQIEHALQECWINRSIIFSDNLILSVYFSKVSV